MLVAEVVVSADDCVDEVLVVVERVEGTEVVDFVEALVEELSVDEVVVTSVELGAELELVVELVVEVESFVESLLELELELVVLGTVEEVDSEEVLWVGSAVVVGLMLVVVAAADVVEAVSDVVAFSWRFTTRSRLAIFSSSSFRASAALMSVGKTPSRNLVERACKAS